MKRAKTTIPIVKEEKVEHYSVECPHCNTILRGGINKHIDRLFCYRCKNSIILNWEALSLGGQNA